MTSQANMTLGTAKIIAAGDFITVTFMNSGSFLIGEQTFGNQPIGARAAMKFCRERGFRIIECR